MNVLLVEANAKLAALWARYLEREGCTVAVAHTQDAATEALRLARYEALVLDLELPGASTIAITDLATYRNPDIAIIVVTASRFFSDGSIFELIPNARTQLSAPVEPADLAAVVGHYARAT